MVRSPSATETAAHVLGRIEAVTSDPDDPERALHQEGIHSAIGELRTVVLPAPASAV